MIIYELPEESQKCSFFSVSLTPSSAFLILVCFIWLMLRSKPITLFPVPPVLPWISVASGGWNMYICLCVHVYICELVYARTVVRAYLREPQRQHSQSRSKLLVCRAVTMIGGRPVKTSLVLSGRAKVLLKRFFWGTLNVVKWSPPQLGHSKRPSLTTRAKQTPSPFTQPCHFASNPFGMDVIRKHPTTRGM